MTKFINIVRFIRIPIIISRRILLIVVALAFAGCAATKQPSLYDAQPDLLTKQYTPDEIVAVKQNFDANPLQYSQELGNFMLWRINAKNNTFGRQLTKLPDLNDGIDINEIDVLKTIDEYVEDVNFPTNFASKAKLEKRNLSEVITKVSDYHILVKWSSQQENYSFGIITIKDPYNNLTLKEVNPKKFEEGDSIVNINAPFNVKTGNALIRINSSTSKDDEDYIELKFSASSNHSLQIGSGGLYTLGDESEIVCFSSTSESAKRVHKIKILEDMTLDGLEHDKFSYSPSLEAFFWLIKDGKFNAESFEKDYPVSLNFTKKVWVEMKEERWDELNEVAIRLNDPKLIDEYQRQNFSYATTSEGYGCGGVDISYSTKGCSPGYIFSSKKGNCAAYTTFAVYCLRRAGYEAYTIRIYSQWDSWFCPNAHPRDYHYVALYKDNDKWYIMDNGSGRGPQGISGPFDTISDLPYRVLNIEN